MLLGGFTFPGRPLIICEFVLWVKWSFCKAELTDNSELSASGVMVQRGVHDAGVHARIVLRHIRDGEAVRVHD